ncbi:HupE/UreJ family protein [Chitinophaga agrisoli]|uniref:HupE/UreJ family protein n=1 Tax=Chitinophaga agrisoli TaxID=2607653 RepID=A0A5B2VSJ9_9BACT|nr:HupE/UreJ family protein [Chitinophaga agrisoli]KAA2241824.1 HupE/UreJ family protein [Chitinophaga agrisoli]
MSEFALYFQLGWQHIIAWDGYDHILFIVALSAVYLLKDWKKVLILVTAFTIGHSITLALSVLNIVRMNRPLVEFLIPVTIFITALFNIIRQPDLSQPRAVQLNYYFALFFGLIHGMGFSTYLKSLLGANVAVPLLSFNLGLEFGQVLVVITVLLMAGIIVNITGVKRRDWIMFLSSAIFGIAFVMAIERFKDLFVLPTTI